MPDRKSSAADQLQNIPISEVQVGDVITIDPIIGREKVTATHDAIANFPGALGNAPIVLLTLESRYPSTEVNYERQVVRRATEPAVLFLVDGQKTN